MTSSSWYLYLDEVQKSTKVTRENIIQTCIDRYINKNDLRLIQIEADKARNACIQFIKSLGFDINYDDVHTLAQRHGIDASVFLDVGVGVGVNNKFSKPLEVKRPSPEAYKELLCNYGVAHAQEQLENEYINNAITRAKQAFTTAQAEKKRPLGRYFRSWTLLTKDEQRERLEYYCGLTGVSCDVVLSLHEQNLLKPSKVKWRCKEGFITHVDYETPNQQRLVIKPKKLRTEANSGIKQKVATLLVLEFITNPHHTLEQLFATARCEFNNNYTVVELLERNAETFKQLIYHLRDTLLIHCKYVTHPTRI